MKLALVVGALGAAAFVRLVAGWVLPDSLADVFADVVLIGGVLTVLVAGFRFGRKAWARIEPLGDLPEFQVEMRTAVEAQSRSLVSVHEKLAAQEKRLLTGDGLFDRLEVRVIALERRDGKERRAREEPVVEDRRDGCERRDDASDWAGTVVASIEPGGPDGGAEGEVDGQAALGAGEAQGGAAREGAGG